MLEMLRWTPRPFNALFHLDATRLAADRPQPSASAHNAAPPSSQGHPQDARGSCWEFGRPAFILRHARATSSALFYATAVT